MDEGQGQEEKAPEALEPAALQSLDAHGDEAHAVLGHDLLLDVAARPDEGQGEVRGHGPELPAEDEGGVEMSPGPPAADDDAACPHEIISSPCSRCPPSSG